MSEHDQDHQDQEQDKPAISAGRLGIAGMVPIVPMLPEGAQVSAQTGMVHFRLMGNGYVRASLPSIPPVRYKEVVAAIRAQPQEPSYSGTGSMYFHLEVVAAGCGGKIMAGETLVGWVAVGEVDIISADVSFEDQAAEGKG